VGGKDLRADLLTVEGRFAVSGDDHYLKGLTANSKVGLANSTGASQFYWWGQFNTLLAEGNMQCRGNVIFAVLDGTVQTYAQALPASKTFQITNIGTLSVLGTATFANDITAPNVPRIKQGAAIVTTGGTSYTKGGFTYQESTHAVTFGYTFSTEPRVHVTLDGVRPTIMNVAVSGISTTGFTLRVIDAEAPKTITVQWLAVLT
jgi:hypothetical protein